MSFCQVSLRWMSRSLLLLLLLLSGVCSSQVFFLRRSFLFVTKNPIRFVKYYAVLLHLFYAEISVAQFDCLNSKESIEKVRDGAVTKITPSGDLLWKCDLFLLASFTRCKSSSKNNIILYNRQNVILVYSARRSSGLHPKEGKNTRVNNASTLRTQVLVLLVPLVNHNIFISLC